MAVAQSRDEEAVDELTPLTADRNGARAAETLAEDRWSAALLFVLYTLQGIPMGLSASIPFLLANRVTYKQQAVLSLVALPFSLKLLWAPVIDGLYSERFGRRKSWLVPVQLLCGFVMLAGASHLPGWMGELSGTEPDVHALAAFFGFLFFLMATQDIAVDGWALTMLSPPRVAWAGAINSVGQTLGYFVAYVGFLALNDEGTCNTFLRAAPAAGGLVSLSGFVAFWGWAFLGTTAVVCVAKSEKPLAAEDGAAGGVIAMYREAWECAKLGPVRQYALVLLTAKLGSAAADSATSLKLTEYGMPKEELAFLSPLLAGAGIVIPLFLSRFTTGPRPLSVYLLGLPLRLLLNPLYMFLVPLAASVYGPDPTISAATFRAAVCAAALANVFAVNMMFVSQMAFANRVADPAIGGTYITLINTVANLGGTWTSGVALYLLDALTTRECVPIKRGAKALIAKPGAPALCATKTDEACTQRRGSCQLVSDGYQTELLVCTALGVAWYLIFRPLVLRLQARPISDWRLRAQNSKKNG